MEVSTPLVPSPPAMAPTAATGSEKRRGTTASATGSDEAMTPAAPAEEEASSSAIPLTPTPPPGGAAGKQRASRAAGGPTSSNPHSSNNNKNANNNNSLLIIPRLSEAVVVGVAEIHLQETAHAAATATAHEAAEALRLREKDRLARERRSIKAKFSTMIAAAAASLTAEGGDSPQSPLTVTTTGDQQHATSVDGSAATLPAAFAATVSLWREVGINDEDGLVATRVGSVQLVFAGKIGSAV